MKHIIKQPEPSWFAKYKYMERDGDQKVADPYSILKDDDKKTLREMLIADQGGICAYCMQRIKSNSNGMKIEHYRTFAKYNGTNGLPNLRLTYRNLLGVCLGKSGDAAHCDTFRGDLHPDHQEMLAIDPLDKNCEKLIRFNLDGGRIYSNDKDVDRELNEILNLNHKMLVQNRKKAYNNMMQEMIKKLGTKHKKPKDWTKTDIQKFIDHYNERNKNNDYHPYCQMIVQLLEKRKQRSPK